MSHTLHEIIHRAVVLAGANKARLGLVTSDGLNELTAQAGTVLGLTDAVALPPGGASDRSFRGWWIWLPDVPAEDQRRVVDTFDGETRTITHSGPQWSGTAVSALEGGATYLLLRDDPHLWVGAAYEALRRRLSEIRFGLLTPTAGQTTYVVTEPSVTERSQIMSVEWAPVDATAGQLRWTSWDDGSHTWNAYSDGGNVVIDFGESSMSPDPTRVQIRVKYARQFDPESPPWDVDLDWAAWATISVLADQLRDPDNASDNWNVLAQQAAREVEGHRRRILATDGYTTVKRTGIRTGISGVRGRL